MSLAICIACGNTKSAPVSRCAKCGFAPTTDADKAKSLILSLNYEIDGEYRGQPKEKLLEIGEMVKREQYKFDQAEVDEVTRYADAILPVPASSLTKELFKWLVWPVALLALMIFIIFRTH